MTSSLDWKLRRPEGDPPSIDTKLAISFPNSTYISLSNALTSSSELDVLLVFYGFEGVPSELDTDGGYFTMSLFGVHIFFFSFSLSQNQC